MRRLLGDIWFRVRALLGHRRMARDMDEEIAFHLEMEERKYRARGLSPEEAHRLARVKFGGEDRFKEQARRSWGVGRLQDLGGDVRFAARQLRRRPAFTLLAVLTLALGIGGTVAIFSVVDGLMLRPLPVANEGGLRVFWMDYDWRGAEFDFARERVKAFSSLAAYSNDAVTLRTEGGSTLVSSTIASAELFDVLGAKPLLGRTFRAGEDRPGAEHVIVLSYGLCSNASAATEASSGARWTWTGDPPPSSG
jgi:putative ABC transport system permease protein